MPFSIPNGSNASFASQAEPDSGDFAIMVAATGGTGVLSGCTVTANSPAALNVAVASGSISVNQSVPVSVGGGNVGISAADATNPRLDLIVASSAGALSAVTGTPAVHPAYPAIPANSVVLAAVYVPANASTIGVTQITDKRVLIAQTTAVAVYNVKDYGAKGNGSTDDTTAIQAAITAASVSGGSVYFPVGTYKISNNLIVNADNVALIGASWGAQIKASGGFPATRMLWYQGPGSGYRNGCLIRNLSFHGNQQSALASVIELDSIRYALIDNIEVLQHPTIGLYLNSTNGTFGAYNCVTNCSFHDSYTGTAIKTNNSEWISFVGCRFLLYNLSGAYGIWTQNLNINITSCQFDAMDTAVYFYFAQYNNITGNQFDEGNTNFIHLNNSNTNTIVGNTFNQHTGSGVDCIYIEGGNTYANIIANNLVKNGVAWTTLVHEAAGLGTPVNTIIGNDCGSATLTLTSGIARANRGYNPVGKLGPPAVPSSGTNYTNAYGVDATVFVAGGTVTAVNIGGNATGLTGGTFRVLAGETISLTYSVAPTWTWFGD